ncbi:MAG: hypothetical protein ABIA77_05210 [Candidatus Omnitrophota bacterium]
MARRVMTVVIIVLAVVLFGRIYNWNLNEAKVLKEVISRLEADSRLAEVLVTGVNYDDASGKVKTTVKFLEYDVEGTPLKPKYFTFEGNIIQFQSLVARFDDIHVRRGGKLKGKSVYLFWKIFVLDGQNTQEYEITKVNAVPEGYRLESAKGPFEKEIWEKFWEYALNPEEAAKAGIKNAQIEAPGAMFIPGMLYTIKIEHDGGLRIDARPLPAVLKGERIPE